MFGATGPAVDAFVEAALRRASSSLVAPSACFVLRSSSWVRFNSFCSRVTRSSSSCERSPHPAKQIAIANIAQNRPAQTSCDRDPSPFFSLSIQTRSDRIKIWLLYLCPTRAESSTILPRFRGRPAVENFVKKACIPFRRFVRRISLYDLNLTFPQVRRFAVSLVPSALFGFLQPVDLAPLTTRRKRARTEKKRRSIRAKPKTPAWECRRLTINSSPSIKF